MRPLRALLLVALGLAVFVGVASASLIAHAQTDVGRVAIRDTVEGMFDRRMAGTTRIGELAAFWPGPITVRDVVVRDPDGRVVLRFDRVDFWMRPARFLSGGDLVARRVHIRGSEVRLVETPSGKLTIERAFEGPGRVRDGRTVLFEHVRFTGTRFVIDPDDVPTVVLEGAEGVGRFERTPEDQRVRMRMERTRAAWRKPDPPGVDIDVARMEGWLDSKGRQTFELSTIGEANGERFALEMRYFPRRKPGMVLHYEALDRSLLTALASAGLDFVEGLSDEVETITELPPREGEERRESRREARRERREERREERRGD